MRTIIHQSIETPEDFLTIRNTCEQFRSLAQTLPVKLRVVHDPRVISCKKMSPYPFLNLYVLHRNTSPSPEQNTFDTLSFIEQKILPGKVEDINVTGEFVSARNIDLFARMIKNAPHLKSLTLNQNDVLLRSLPDTIDDFHQNIYNALQTLGSAISDSAITSIQFLEKDPVSVPDGEKRYIRCMKDFFPKNLENLSIEGLDEGIPEALCDLKGLKSLSLPLCAIDATFFSRFQDMPKLERLILDEDYSAIASQRSETYFLGEEI